jgi:phosphoribosyl 1,2-cyclic phosphodiesterase
MSLYIASLNSGSNGNSFYVGNDQDAVLIDAGISCRETEKRLARLGLIIHHVKAIFISHEHTDHIRGVGMLANKYRIPVYITQKTMLYSRMIIDSDLIKGFIAEKTIQIGGLKITAFSKTHDAVEPHSFVVNSDEVKVGIFTDLGYPCENLIHHFKGCHAAFLEANYDDNLLEQGNYPNFLKNRIRGGKGHLSNQQALNLFIQHRSPQLSHLILSHLSANNNCPNLVNQLFQQYARTSNIIIASRFKETALFHIKQDVSCGQLTFSF